MDEAVGDLKQALPCVVEPPAVHVEILQRRSRLAMCGPTTRGAS